MDILFSIIGIVIFGLFIFGLWFLGKGIKTNGVDSDGKPKRILKLSFTVRILIALALGAGYGIVLQLLFGTDLGGGDVGYDKGTVGYNTSEVMRLVGSAFSNALTFTIVPLVLISMIRAITKMSGTKNGATKVIRILGTLLVTTAIAAVVAIVVVKIFALAPIGLDISDSSREPQSIIDVILSFFPRNIFTALNGGSMLAVLFVSIIIGMAFLYIKKENAKLGAKFESMIEGVYAFVAKILDIVLGFTPYAVLGLIGYQLASGSFESIKTLAIIIGANFVGLAIMFVIHLAIIALFGVRPDKYLKKTSAPLVFAFSSRSSSATLPLTVKSQRSLGVSDINANLSSTLGLTIGQNGCAGIYPTIVALLVGTVTGVNVWSVSFLLPLVIYVVIASLGSGGGSTNSSLMVLSLLGLPTELVAILFSVDFIIDMGRTAVNVNGAIVAGFVSGKLEKDINKDILDDKITYDEWLLSQGADNTTDADSDADTDAGSSPVASDASI